MLVRNRRLSTTSLTYVKVTIFLECKTLSLRCSNVSPANCGSSLTVTLYRRIVNVKTAIASVSENLEEGKNSGDATRLTMR